jgi:hypothetical protein
MGTVNLVLYALENGERRPLISLTEDDDYANPKISHKVSAAMRDAELRGVAHPKFKLVREEREADESGATIVRAAFVELDPVTLKPRGKIFSRMAELFAPPPAQAPVVDPKQQKSAEMSR